MKCNEFEILISDYLDATISPVDKMNFEEHLRACESCNHELSETAKLLEKVSALPLEIAPGTDLWKNVESRILPGKQCDKIYTMNGKDEIEKYRQLKTNRIYKYAVITAIAAILMVVILPALFRHQGELEHIEGKVGPMWKVTRTMGISLISSNLLETTGFLKEGEELETKDSSRAVVEIEGLGTVSLEPNTKIKFLKGDSSEKRISVLYGSIHANIDAKPRTFYVETKSATAIDLGCVYNMSVDTSGDAMLYVQKGSVIWTSNGRESLVPEGKYCMSKTGIGPGTPYRENSSKELKDALLRYDFGHGGSAAVRDILKHAKTPDAVTLINILPRVEDENKSKVYERLNRITPPPRNIPADSIPHLKLDDLCDWAIKLQKQINEEIHEKMQQLQIELKENLHDKIKMEFGDDFNSPEFQKKMEERIESNLDNLDKLEYLDTINVNIEIPMQHLNIQMEKLNEELEKNNEKIQEEMEKLQEHMGKFNYEFQEKWQKKQEEMNEKMREKQEKQMEKQQEHMEKNMERQQEKQQQEIELQQEKQQQEIQRQIDKQMQEQQEKLDKQQQKLDEQQQQKDKEHKDDKDNDGNNDMNNNIVISTESIV